MENGDQIEVIIVEDVSSVLLEWIIIAHGNKTYFCLQPLTLNLLKPKVVSLSMMKKLCTI